MTTLQELRRAAQVVRSGRLRGGALRQHQIALLRARVRDAQRHVPLYRDHLAGIDPEQLTPGDLASLPRLGRAQVQSAIAAGEMLDARLSADDCLERPSGGASGQPLFVLARPEDRFTETLIWLRSWGRAGLRPWHKQVTIRDVADIRDSPRNQWFQRLGLLRVAYINIFDDARDTARQLAADKPDVLRGPPSALATAAEFAESHPARPSHVFCAGETLAPETRARLSDAFAAPVRDFYGATEAGCIAHETDSGTYRVNADAVLVEVLDPEGTPVPVGGSGEVYVTNLFASAMPFIRYRLGDVAEVGEVSEDGQTVTEIASLSGRALTPYVSAVGRPLSPYMFIAEGVRGVTACRSEQPAPGEVIVHIETGAQIDQPALDAFVAGVKAYAAADVTVEFRISPDGPPDVKART